MVSSFIVFFLFRDLSLAISGWHIFFFLLHLRVLISPSLLNIFTGNRILGWQFFSFNTWKILCLFLLASMVSDDKFAVVWIAFPTLAWCHFSLAGFKIFFPLSLVFNGLIMMWWEAFLTTFINCSIHFTTWLLIILHCSAVVSWTEILSF